MSNHEKVVHGIGTLALACMVMAIVGGPIAPLLIATAVTVCAGAAIGYATGGKMPTIRGGSSSKYLEQLDNLSDNKINHINNGSKNSNHGWEKLVPDKNWNDLKKLLQRLWMLVWKGHIDQCSLKKL